MILILPALFAIVFLGVQGAFYYHAHTLAVAAAEEGARTAAALDSTAGAGITAAADFVADAGGTDVLTDVRVGGNRDATSARVTITGRSTSILPWWKPTVSAAAAAPVERVTAP